MRFLTFILSCGLSLVLSHTAVADEIKLSIDGVEREALVFPPSRNPVGAKAPLVFAFHWHGGSAEEAASTMLFQSLWPEAIVVYMQGLPTRIYVDPLGLGTGWQQEPNQFGDRDLKFFDAVLVTLRAKFPVDDTRIYATGFSNGGIFTYLLWGTRGKIFAAFAPVAAQKFPQVRLTDAKPVLHIAGTFDNVVPFKDQLESIRIARQVNGRGEKGDSCGRNCTIYGSGSNAPVMTYIHGGAHVYPPQASEMIVKFLQAYRLIQ
jgi:polyhydroxybutyrate depolymerase